MRATKDNVIIETFALPHYEKIEGVFVPSSSAPRQDGLVRSVGPQVVDVKVGDRVFFDRYLGTNVTRDDRTFKVVKERELLAIITDE